jgi:hypothetical protein
VLKNDINKEIIDFTTTTKVIHQQMTLDLLKYENVMMMMMMMMIKRKDDCTSFW